MEPEPVIIALKEIGETRHLLESLIKSSESFDYIGAKDVLAELNRKVRTLAVLQANLAARSGVHLDERIVPFPGLRAR